MVYRDKHTKLDSFLLKI